MTTMGMIGGLGPQATIYYYQRMIDQFQNTYDKTGFPHIIIESLNIKTCLELSSNGRWDDLAKGLTERCDALLNAGAHFGLIASNTPHKVFDQIQSQTRLPLLSILDTTRTYLQEHRFKKPLLLGTGFTMKSDFFTKILKQVNIHPVVPDEESIVWIHDKIFSEIEFNIIKPETKKRFIEIIEKHRRMDHVDCVILGCTELPLIIQSRDTDLPRVDTAEIHADSAVSRYLYLEQS
ncbi:MAG: amino acid racemase [candidate division KSB1 bacterium]|nr:amino acid racemase [candidate division KSB1 bacterium]